MQGSNDVLQERVPPDKNNSYSKEIESTKENGNLDNKKSWDKLKGELEKIEIPK